MFGFQSGWSTGLTQFTDLSEKVQKLKTGLEAGLQDSGLLGPGEAPLKEAQLPGESGDASQAYPSKVPQEVDNKHGTLWAQDIIASTNFDKDAPDTLQASGDWQAWGQAHMASEARLDNVDASHALQPESGWEEQELGLEVPEASDDAQADHRAEAATASSVLSTRGSEAVEDEAQTEEALLEVPSAVLPVQPASEPCTPQAAQTPPATEVLGVPAVKSAGGADSSGGGPGEESWGDRDTAGGAHSPQSDQVLNCKLHSLEPVDDSASPDLPHSDPHDKEPPELAADTGRTQGPQESITDGGKGKEALTQDEIDAMPLEELRVWAFQQQATLQAREVQLERKFEEVANMHNITNQLMSRNEELARKAAKASEEDIKLLTDEYESRLGVLERKIYALTKERDMLKRGQDKLSSATDLIKEKDSIIAQVMAEGEQLSKKQLSQESTIRKLRQQIKEAEYGRTEVTTELTLERQKLEALAVAKQKAENDLGAARQSHKAELDAERAHYEGLAAKARAAQIEAENRAAASAKEGLSRKLKEAETRVEMLTEQVSGLQMSMERQRAAADLREDMLKRELANMERRNQEAEARHEELTGKLPDATRPLLRQIEGMQRTAAAHQQAWQAAEQALQARLEDAEARAAIAVEKERLATDRLQAANSRATSLGAVLDTLREECGDLQDRLDAKEEDLRSAKQQCQKLEEQVTELHSRLASVEEDKLQVERGLEAQLLEEKQAGSAMLAAAESRAAVLEDRLRQLASGSSLPPKGASGEPPAMAGPGFKWVLVREGEEAAPPTLEQNEVGPSPRGTYLSSGRRATAPELAQMRDALAQKEEQLASYQSTISQLEATRDSLAEELVNLSQSAEQREEAWRSLQRAQQEHLHTQQKLAACTELLGEREERILELTADIADMKALYQEQIEFVLELSASRSPSAAASSVSSWVPGPER